MEPTDPVGFSAYAASSATYSWIDFIQFNETLTNVGGAYNHTHSIFTCPYTGLYAFQVHLMTEPGDEAPARFMKNGYAQIGLRVDDLSEQVDAMRNSASTSMIIECNAGDVMWVQANALATIYSSQDNKESSFSGFLIARYE